MITSTITNNTIILPKTGYYDSNEETESDRSSTISIFHLTSRYCSARVTVSLPSHGRGDFFPQPWQAPTTAVGRSRHGRDEL